MKLKNKIKLFSMAFAASMVVGFTGMGLSVGTLAAYAERDKLYHKFEETSVQSEIVEIEKGIAKLENKGQKLKIASMTFLGVGLFGGLFSWIFGGEAEAEKYYEDYMAKKSLDLYVEKKSYSDYLDHKDDDEDELAD